MKFFSPFHTVRGRLLVLAISIEALMLTVLVTNSLRLLHDAMTSQARSQAEQFQPVLEAALTAPLAQRDYATVQAVIDESRTAGGVDYIVVVDSSGKRAGASGWPADRPLPAPSGDIPLFGSGKTPRYDVARPINMYGQSLGTLHFGLDLSRIVSARRSLFLQGGGIAAVEIVLSSLILLILGYWLTRHLTTLTRASLEVASGNLSPPPVPEGRDDVGQLGVAFNTMSRAIAERVAELTAAKETAEASERAKTESETRFRILADRTTAGIYMVQGLRLVMVNPAMTTITGYSHDELLGMEFPWLIHPDHREMVQERMMARQQGEDVVSSYEVRMVTREGESRWVEQSVGLVSVQGRPTIIATAFDVTDRRRATEELDASQRKYRTLTESMKDVVWTLDVETMRFLYISPSIQALTGYTPEELLAEPLGAALLPGNRETLQTLITKRAAELRAGTLSPDTYFTTEVEQPRKDGSTVWTEVITHFLFNEETGVVEAHGVARDITERKHHEAGLKQARIAAEAANTAKSEFLANMSHEIRTPMNAVLGLAQVLEREPLSPDQRDIVQRIRTAGQSLLDILNDILDFSKIEAGQLRIEKRSFALAPLLARLESLLGNTAHAKGIALWVEAPAELEGSLIGDPLRLEQILINMIGNSIKFTERGDIQVRVQLLDANDHTVRLRFEVRDTGVGIAPDVLNRLFAPFTQADGSITRRFGGTGLGLSICRRLVELMGGTVGVASTVGVGSTFWFELSFQRATSGQKVPLPSRQDAAPAGPRLSGRCFLVVDDSSINQDVVARALKLEGAEVTLAGDGQQALQQLRMARGGFDAVLMDVQMPVMDGLTATRSIRSELYLYQLPVIAFTAGVLRQQQQEALEAGVNDFLPKPVDLEQMVAVLLHWCRSSAAAGDAPPSPDPVAAAPSLDVAPDFPRIPGTDPQRAAATLGDDRELFLELLQRFAAEYHDTAQLIQTDLFQGDRETAARRAHTLRGVVGNFGAMDLMRTAQVLEEAIGGGRTDLDALVQEVGTQLAALIEASAPWLGDAAATTPLPPVIQASPIDPVRVAPGTDREGETVAPPMVSDGTLTASVQLLADRIPAPAEGAPAEAPAASGREAPTPLRILLVEDIEECRLLVHVYLKKTPCLVDDAENGRAAIEKFTTGRYDLVLMDVLMPVMDGYTATREIRKWEAEERRASTPIIALTAYASADERQKSLDAGCTAHLTKPIDRKTLLAAIEQYAPFRPNTLDGGKKENR